MRYLDEHIRDIIVKDAKEVSPIKKDYLCTKDYIMDDGSLAYKKGVVYTTDGKLNDEGLFIMPSIFDKTHKMNTDDDFYEHFSDVNKPTKDSVVESVIESFRSRSEAGFKKYGTNLDRKDLSALEWINHFQQELQDAILYAEKLKSYVPNQSPNVMVINEKDLEDNETSVIGVVSDRDNALKIIKEYYGEESTMSDFRDVRDSGLDFTVDIEVPGYLGGKYHIWVEDFYINTI